MRRLDYKIHIPSKLGLNYGKPEGRLTTLTEY